MKIKTHFTTWIQSSRPRRSFNLMARTGLALMCLTTNSARATSATWLSTAFDGNWEVNGTTEVNWSTDTGGSANTNWPGGTSTSSGDVATFNGPSAHTAVSINGSDWNIGSIVFTNSTCASYTINNTIGSENSRFTGGGSIMITSAVTNAQVFSGDEWRTHTGTGGGLSLINNSTTPTATLTLGGGIKANNSANANPTNQSINLQGSNTGSNVVSGAILDYATLLETGGSADAAYYCSVTKSGTGSWYLTASNTYTGPTIISGGMLALRGAGSINYSTNVIVSGASAILDFTNVMSLTTAGIYQPTTGNYVIVTNAGTLRNTNTINQTALTVANLVISNATLELGVNGNFNSTDLIVVTSALTVWPGTVIDIARVVNLTSATTFNLISYAGADPLASDFTVTVPTGYTAGSVSVGSGLVQVTITPPSSTSLYWVGANTVTGSNWDTITPNWVDGGNNPMAYANPDSATFNDSAVVTNVILTSALTPLSVTVNDSSEDYTFTGSGSLGDPIGDHLTLIKEGASTTTLMLEESGGDNFSGGITNYAGTIILDNANSAISGGLGIENGSTVQVGNNDANGALPAGGVDDEGTLIFDQTGNTVVPEVISGGGGALTQNGSGTLTLSGVNSYGGYTTINAGTLALTGAGSISGSYQVAVNGATLDVSGVTGGSTGMNSLNFTGGTLTVGAGYLETNLNVNSVTLNGGNTTINVRSLPPIASYPATNTLIYATNGITLNGFNFVAGSLPPASPAYTGASISENGNAVVLILTGGPVAARPYVIWSGADSLDSTNWSDAQDWAEPGVPNSGTDIVIFNDTGAASGGSPFNALGDGPGGIQNPNNINNVVDQNFTLSSLTFTNINYNGTYYQNTWISNNLTLSITGAGGLVAGNENANVDFGAASEDVTIFGTNGLLDVNNAGAPFLVGLGTTGGSAGSLTLDMSGLGTFNASVSLFYVGVEYPTSTQNRPAGILWLAATNTIKAGFQTTATETTEAPTASGALIVGDGSGNNGGDCYLWLGQSNNIMADTILVAREKTTHGQIEFNPNFSTPVATIGGFSTNRVATWSIGDGVANGGTTTCNGTVDFSAGTVNAQVNTMYIGRASTAVNGTAPGAANESQGTFTFAAGTVNVNTIYAGLQTANNNAKYGVGTINVNSNSTLGEAGTLIINGALYLSTNTATSTSDAATLNINNGTVWANSIVPGGGNSTINMYGGALIVTNPTVGTPALGLNTLVLSPSGGINGGNDTSNLLQLAADSANPAITVTNLTIDGTGNTTNVINLTSMPPIESYPVEIPLIRYTSFNPGSGTFNIGMGTFPSNATPYAGTVIYDSASNQVALYMTSGPLTLPLTWDGTVSAIWNGTDANWSTPYSPPDTVYLDGDPVTFDDSLTSSHTNISLTNFVQPSSVTFGNNSQTYIFTGPGGIAGTTGLAVSGSGTAILDNSGGNSFTGLVAISNGKLQIGNNDAGGSFTASVTNTSPGALAFDRSDNPAYAGGISGNGSVIQTGAGILTLTAANTGFSGGVQILNGTVRPGVATALGTGATVANGGTLDLNGLNMSALPVQASGAGFGGKGAIINNGAAQTQALTNVTVLASATFGGSNRWDIRGPNATLKASGSAVTLTKVGANQVSLVATTASDANLQNLIIEQGTFALQTSTTQFGSTSGLITVWSNASLECYGLTAGLNKNISLLDGGQIWSENNSTTISGTIYLNNNGGNTAPGTGIITNDANGTGASLVVASVISGPGNLLKTGAGTTVLSNANIFAGTTTVAAGTLDANLSGSLPGGVIINAGELKMDSASAMTSSASLTVASGATVYLNYPGNQNIAALTVAGTAQAPGVYGSGALNPGSVFTNGSGTLTVVSSSPSPAQITSAVLSASGTAVTITGTNGVHGGTFYVLTSTNVSLPLLQWTTNTMGTFDGSGNFNINLNITPTTPQSFFNIAQP